MTDQQDDMFKMLENPEIFDEKGVTSKTVVEKATKPKLEANPEVQPDVSEISDEILERWRPDFFYEDGQPKKERDIKLTSRGPGSLYDAGKEILGKGTSSLKKSEKIEKIFEAYGVSTGMAAKEIKKQETEPEPENQKSARRVELECNIQKLSIIYNDPIPIEQLESMTLDELELMYGDYSQKTGDIINQKGELMFVYVLLYGKGVESMAPVLGLNCHGLTSIYNDSKDDIIATLSELIAENPAIERILTPQVRLLFHLVITPVSLSLKKSMESI